MLLFKVCFFFRLCKAPTSITSEGDSSPGLLVEQGDSDVPGGSVLGFEGIWGWERGSEVKLC